MAIQQQLKQRCRQKQAFSHTRPCYIMSMRNRILTHTGVCVWISTEQVNVVQQLRSIVGRNQHAPHRHTTVLPLQEERGGQVGNVTVQRYHNKTFRFNHTENLAGELPQNNVGFSTWNQCGQTSKRSVQFGPCLEATITTLLAQQQQRLD